MHIILSQDDMVAKTVEGNPKYVDLVHLHECMRKHLFNY